MLDSPKLTSVLYCSLALLTSLLIPPQVAAPVVKPMPFEDEYITEIAAIDYPEERIEAYTDGGMVEYIRDKRAEPSPSPTYWPIEEVVTTSRYPIMDEDGIIEIIRQKKEAEHAVMFRPVKEYITTTRYPLLGSDGTFQVIRNKRAAQPGSTKFWPVREIITTTRRPFRKGYPPNFRNRRAEPAPSNKPYLKEYITSQSGGARPYVSEQYVTTVTYPVYDKFYDSGFLVRPKRAASGFFQQCLAKLVGVGIGVALVAALIYYFWYRRLKKAKQQSEEEAEFEEREAFNKRRKPHKVHHGDDLENDYHYQASPG